MTVTEGMDVERVRSIAQQLLGQSTKIEDVRASGQGQMGVLDAVWSGADLDHFEARWHHALPQLHHAGQALRDFGRELIRQADEQQGVSGVTGPGSRPTHPLPPPTLPPGRCAPGQSVLDDLVRGIKDTVSRVWESFEGAVDWVKDNIWGPLGIPLIIKDVVEGLRQVSEDFARFTDEALRGTLKWFDETFPKLLKWGERLAPVGRILGKFGKVIPGVGVGFWAWDLKDVAVDFWNGEVNPAELWNKGVLGTGSMIAGFFPGYGTLISAALGVEQLRHEYMPQAEQWLSNQLGLPPTTITTVRATVLAPIMPLGLADLLPNRNLDLPGPSPREMAETTWNAVLDAGDTLVKYNPLPWP